jgi:hypothetical protein
VIIRLCLLAAMLLPSSAIAQGNPGPFGKLFGREPARANKDQTKVDLNGSLGGQFGDALPGSVTDDVMPEGISSGARADLSVAHSSPRYQANFGGGVIREYSFAEPAPPSLTQYQANASVRSKAGTRFEPSAAASYTHSPYYQFFPVFGQGAIAVDNSVLPYSPYAIQRLDTEAVDAAASLVTHISSKSTIELSVFGRQTRFADQPASDFAENGYGAVWALRLGRGLGVHAGYENYQGEYHAIDQSGAENKVIDAGIDFNRAFSLSRRTTFAIATSTSLVKDSRSTDTRFRLNGQLSLAKQFRRTWSATISATRSTEFVPGFIEPLFFGASISGMFTKRLDWLAYASGGQGEYAFSRSSGFNSLTASSRLRIALGKHISAYGQYIAYWYEIPPGVTTFDLPSRTARQSVAAGLSVYVPIYDHVRKAK